MSELLEGRKLFFEPNTYIYTQLIKFQENPYHRHDFIEFAYVISGSATHLLNGAETKLQPRSAFLLVYKDEHAYKEPNDRFMHRDILIDDSFFRKICNFYSRTLYEEIIEKKLNLSFSIGTEELTKLESLAAQFELRNDKNKVIIQKQICIEILGLILINNSGHENRKSWVSRLIIFLSSPEYVGESLNDILDKNFPYSREYMCRTFKEMTGMTMTEYFNLNKMKYADTLIKSGDYTNEEVQEIVNIKNTSYFYRLYKKTFGKTSRQNKN